MIKVNPFLRINFFYEVPHLTLVNIDKNYKVSDFVVFVLFTVKNNSFDKKRLEDYICDETSYSITVDEIDTLIQANILIEDESILEFSCKSVWDSYNWSEVFNYLQSTKDYPFLDYESGKTFIEDQNMMESYIDDGSMPAEKRLINSSDKISLLEDVKLDLPISEMYKWNTVKKTDLENISIIFKSWFWYLGRNYLWFWRFPKKIVPSWWSRHPSEGYFFDFKWEFKKWWVFYYDGEENDLTLVNQYDDLREQVNNISFNFLDTLDFEPKYWIWITSNLLRSMWRYRDSRSYRVLFNDVWHITSVITDLLSSLWLTYTEFSFIEEDKFLESTNSKVVEDSILEKPLYFILFR